MLFFNLMSALRFTHLHQANDALRSSAHPTSLSGMKSAEIYAGVNESDNHPFTERNFKKVFSVK
jgi:hypothetical protein